MGTITITRHYTLPLLISLFLFSFVHSSNNTAAESLDATLHKHAFNSLVHHQPRTGALYDPVLPASLAGMQVSIVRLRSRTLWTKGANFSNFQIPSRTLPIPHVKRLFLVYQDLGNWSSLYYNTKGCSLVSSVLGLTAYDASKLVKNITRLDLDTMGQPISVQFTGLGTKQRIKCALFGDNGKVKFSDVSVENVCYGRNEGHFAIVVVERSRADLWVVGLVVGSVIVALAGCVGGVFAVKVLKAKRIEEMERGAEEGVVLGTIWVGNSKMHCASVTRTHPVFEDPSYG